MGIPRFDPAAYYAPPPQQYVPPVNQIPYRATDDEYEALRNERARATSQGDIDRQSFISHSVPELGQSRRYSGLADQSYENIFRGGGGYDENTQARLRDSQRLNMLEMAPDMLEMTPEEWDNRFYSEEEKNAIRGDPYASFDYFQPGRYDDINRLGAEGQFGAIDYGANRFDQDLGASSGRIRDLYGNDSLGISSEFADGYNFTDQDVQETSDLGGKIAAERYRGMLNDIKRRTVGAGDAGFAQAALQDRYGRQSNIAVADAATQARLAARGLQLNTIRGKEDVRLGAEQYQAGLGTQAEDALLGRSLGAHGQIMDAELGAQRDVADRALGTEQHVQGTGIGLEQYGDQTTVGRAHDLANVRATTEQRAQDTRYGRGLDISRERYGRGLDISRERYGRDRDIAGAQRADEQEGRDYLSGSRGFHAGQFQEGADRNLRASSDAGQRSLGAASAGANYDIGRKTTGSFLKREVLPWVETGAEIAMPFLTGAAAPGGGGESGGVFTQPTNVTVGESGPEAVIPLAGSAGAENSPPALRSIMKEYVYGQNKRGQGQNHRRKPNPQYMGMSNNSYTETPDSRYSA